MYTGEWKGGEKNGKGELQLASKITIMGEWKNDKLTGMGTVMFPNGERYEGQFLEGEKNGQGLKFE